MLGYLQKLGLLDILSVSLIAIATGLGFSVGILAPFIPFAYPTALIAVVAVFLASFAAIVQSISANKMSEDIYPQPVEEKERTVPEIWHRELVNRAHNEGYSEGRLRGYREGLRTDADLPKHGENRQSSSKSTENNSQRRDSETVGAERSEGDTRDEMSQETEEGTENKAEEQTEGDEQEDEDVPPEIKERINELEREVEKE
jgi:hypothetical protein